MRDIVVIGGGTGTSIVLAALRRLGVASTAIIPTSDSGGSSGKLRQELGIIPVGDIRQCVLALGEFSKAEQALWNTRFTRGQLDGHALGNLILAGLLQNSPTVNEALERARKIWNLKGSIIPMTRAPTTLCAFYNDGTRICDEHSIDEQKKLHGGIERIALFDPEPASPNAIRALSAATLIVLAPGDLYTSIIPVLLPRGMRNALARSHAPMILIANLMTKHGQTDGFTVSRLVAEVNRYLDPRRIDLVLINSSCISKEQLAHYRKQKQQPILGDLGTVDLKTTELVKAPLLDTGPVQRRIAGDRLYRSTIRHDPKKLARALMRIIK